MKKMVIVGAVLAAAASVACGAQLINIAPLSTATNATTVISSLSQSGVYAGGYTMDSSDGLISAAYYNLTTNTWSTVPQQSGTLAMSGIVTGVAHVTGGTMFRAAGNMNDNGNRTYGVANQFGTYADGSGTNGGTLRFAPSSETMVGVANIKDYVTAAGSSARSTADGSDAWMVGYHSQGATTRGNEGYIWKGSSGGTAYATALGRNNSQAKFLSVSNAGRAVGWDSGTAVRCAMYANAGAGGSISVSAVGLVADYNSAANSSAFGISENGDYVVGYQQTTLTTRNQGFIWKVGDATATTLKGPDGTINNTGQQSYAAAVSDDGVVVGYQYSNVVSPAWDSACVWWDASATPIRLLDLAANEGIDLTGWTSLGKGATAIEKIGNQYYIAGYGTYNGYARGFVLVVPEPATLSLLVLGGLAMLRRRR